MTVFVTLCKPTWQEERWDGEEEERDKERKRENERAMGWDSERKTDRKGR